MAGRTLYHDQPGVIQSDGGRISWWTGACKNINQGVLAEQQSMPAPDTLDFASGANLVASRDFVESIGLMTDSDNTAGTAVTFYGDITLHSAPTVENRGT